MRGWGGVGWVGGGGGMSERAPAGRADHEALAKEGGRGGVGQGRDTAGRRARGNHPMVRAAASSAADLNTPRE